MSIDNKGPVTGGNQLTAMEYLKLLNHQFQTDQSYEFSLKWLILLSQMTYFSNLFNFITGDERYLKLENLFFTNLWWYGKVGILKTGEKIDVVNLTNTLDGEYIQIAKYIFNSNVQPKDTNIINRNRLLNKNDDRLVIFRWGSTALPGFIWWWQFAQEQNFMWKAVFSESMWINKKLQIDFNLELTDQNKFMLKSLFNPSSPFFFHNNIETLSEVKQLELPPLTTTGFDMIDRHRQMYYQMFGRRINENYKKEKNITDDIQFSMSNYNIIENDWLRELKIGAIQLKEKFNDILEFEHLDKLEPSVQGGDEDVHETI